MMTMPPPAGVVEYGASAPTELRPHQVIGRTDDTAFEIST